MANKIFVAVEFRLIVFRPFKNEVMLGRISSATEDGIRVRTQFFDQVFIPFSGLPEGSELYVLLLTYVPYCFALLPPISRRNQRSHSLPSPSPKTNPLSACTQTNSSSGTSLPRTPRSHRKTYSTTTKRPSASASKKRSGPTNRLSGPRRRKTCSVSAPLTRGRAVHM